MSTSDGTVGDKNGARFRDARCPRCFHQEHARPCPYPVMTPGFGSARVVPCNCLTLLTEGDDRG